jgi:hypothetical protein
MATQEETETGRVVFPCECRGCRGRDADLRSVWRWEHIPDRVTHFYDHSTRRFFRARILSWRHLDRGALAVRESSAGDMDNTWRAHRVVVFCRYGKIVERYPVAVGDAWRTGAAAARFMAALPGDAAAGCGCHGCTLDRNGRGQA